MAYDLASLITTIRKRAKDTTFDADLITDFIQSTQNTVLTRSRFPFMEVSDDDSVAAGSTDYELDNEVDVVLSLILVDADDNPTRPEYLGYAEFYDRFDPETSSSASPCYYTIYGNTLIWQAPLDRAYTVNVKYLKAAATLALDTDVPAIPERFKEILIRGALAGIEDYRDNYDISAVHERKVEELAEDMLGRLSLRQLATPHKARFGRR